MFFMFIFATEKITEMKKTILFSILWMLSISCALSVSLPSEGLLPSASYSEGDFITLPGSGNFRSSDQNSYPNDGAWEGTWDSTYGKTSAVDAMGMSPADYVSINYPYNSTYVSFDGVLAAILGPCESQGGDYYDCYNYAVDVYNIALANWSLPLGGLEFVHYLMVPVSTDITFLALMLAAYLGFVAYRKKHFLAKA